MSPQATDPTRQAHGEVRGRNRGGQSASPAHCPHGTGAATRADLPALAARVARRRGLPLSRLPALEVLAAEQLQAAAIALLERRPESRRAWRGQRDLLERLELIPTALGAPELLRRSTAALEGFYDPERNALLLLDCLTRGERTRVLGHELAHALQDEHFDVGERGPTLGALSSDALEARLALAEGDAEWVASQLDTDAEGRDARTSAPSDDATRTTALARDEARVPDVLRRASTARYRAGRSFVARVVADGGTARLNEIWQRPPETTEQLLHPDRPSARERPRRLRPAPPPPGDGWAVEYEDTLGELAARTVYEQWVVDARARAVAAGWGGDSLTTFRRGEARALSWRLHHDSRADAEQAWRVVARGLFPARRATPGRDGSAPRATSHCRPHRDNGVVGGRWHGREVQVLALRGGSEATCAALERWAAVGPDAQ